jgi:hypothetical protein
MHNTSKIMQPLNAQTRMMEKDTIETPEAAIPPSLHTTLSSDYVQRVQPQIVRE